MGNYLEAIGIVLLFFVVLYGAYFLSRSLGKMQMKRSVGSNMAIIEILPVGQQKTLQLVRVGNEYMVIGVTKDRITFIERIDGTGLSLENESETIVPFSNFMKKLIKKNDLGEALNEHHKK